MVGILKDQAMNRPRQILTLIACALAAASMAVSCHDSSIPDDVDGAELEGGRPGTDGSPVDCVVRRPDGECADPTGDDYDGDGYEEPDDCDDRDSASHPGANEIRCNGRDEDCDGSDLCYPDADGDGVTADGDCNDHDADRSPLLPEILCNGIDDDCSGSDVCDRDGDGVGTPDDCNDEDPTVYPFAIEIPCDGVDQDCRRGDCCDGDQDGDGYRCADDCDDSDHRIHPGADPDDFDRCFYVDVDCDGERDNMSCL